MSKTERQQYKIAGPATWELIRAAYLGGESARALAERFGVGEHAIRKRITVEKWSKRAYAAAREVEMNALIDRIAAEEEAADIAAALERRALAQASAAMVQGRSKEAAALASMAEVMRKRVDEERQREAASRAQAASQVAEVKRCRELDLAEKFRYAAFLAYCMVHNPKGAPAIFVDLVAGIRREAFGEGDEESYAAARRSALESRRYFGLDEDTWDAAFMATFPDDEDEARDPSPAWEGAAHPRPSASPTPSPALAGEGTVEN